ncbi:hypothetical protein HZS_7396 [Henneguya salminicola]|nr:hypothetical protein HZS_7396 [Henneguya salminicola]
MLLPSANGEQNCNKFINLVTGVCRGTIRKARGSLNSNFNSIMTIPCVKKDHKERIRSKTKKKFCLKNNCDNTEINIKNGFLSTVGSITLPTSSGNIKVPVRMDIPLMSGNHEIKIGSNSDLPISSFPFDQTNSCFNLYKNNNMNTPLIHIPSASQSFQTVSCDKLFIPNKNPLISTSQFNATSESFISLTGSQSLSNNMTSIASFIQPNIPSIQVPVLTNDSNYQNIVPQSLILTSNSVSKDLFSSELLYTQNSAVSLSSGLNSSFFTVIPTNSNSLTQNYILM